MLVAEEKLKKASDGLDLGSQAGLPAPVAASLTWRKVLPPFALQDQAAAQTLFSESEHRPSLQL